MNSLDYTSTGCTQDVVGEVISINAVRQESNSAIITTQISPDIDLSEHGYYEFNVYDRSFNFSDLPVRFQP